MAINRVPQGQIGTGAAQVLGPNIALQQWMGQNTQDSNRLVQERARYDQRNEQMNTQFNKYLSDIELASGSSKLYKDDVAELSNQLMKRGAELKANGINPWNPSGSPEQQAAARQFISDANKIKSTVAMLNDIGKERADLLKTYKNNSTEYDFDEYQKIYNLEKENSLEDLISGKAQVPGLNKIFNVSEGITKQYGELYNERTQPDTDDQGNPIMRTVREADVPRITAAVNNSFRSGTPYANEVNRQLRKTFGENATIDGLLGTVDRDQIRATLDAEFRSPTADNPIAELMASGKVPSLDSPQYEQFLEDSVNSQLEAEKILDNNKQLAANALSSKVNPRDNFKYDFSVQREKRSAQSHATSERNKNASYMNTLLRSDKLRKGGSGSDDDAELLDESDDITFETSEDTDAQGRKLTGGLTLFGANPISATTVSINPTKGTNATTGKTVQEKEINRGTLTGIGVIGLDKDGNPVRGQDIERLMQNPKVVSFDVRGAVQHKKSGSQKVQTSLKKMGDIPVDSFAKDKRADAQKKIAYQQKRAEALNEELKNKRKETKSIKLTKGSLDNL